MHYKHGLFYSLFLLSLIMYLFLLLLHIFSSYLLFVSFIHSKTINFPLITQSLSASSHSLMWCIFFFSLSNIVQTMILFKIIQTTAYDFLKKKDKLEWECWPAYWAVNSSWRVYPILILSYQSSGYDVTLISQTSYLLSYCPNNHREERIPFIPHIMKRWTGYSLLFFSYL